MKDFIMSVLLVCFLLLICIGTALIALQPYAEDLYVFKIGTLLAILGVLGMYYIETNDINKKLFKIEANIIHINGSIDSLNIRSKNLDKRIKQIDIKLKG